MKGKKAHLILRQDGHLDTPSSSRKRYGLWTGNLQHFSMLHMEMNGSPLKCMKYVRRPWYIYREYSHLSRIDFVPPGSSFACISLATETDQDLTISLEINHSKMWPSVERPGTYRVRQDDKGLIQISSDLGQTFISLSGSHAEASFKDGKLTLQVAIKARAFISIGSEIGSDEEELFEQAERYYGSAMENCVLKSSLFRLDKTFFWSKIAIIESYSETEVGNGFFAGFPEFSWFFGRDGLWTSFSAYMIGLSEMADEHLDLLLKNASDGRIPHEVTLSLADQTGQNFEVSGVKGIMTKYMSIDSTPLWIIAQGYREAWTGKPFDKGNLMAALSFLRNLDRDNDGLIENSFSEGLMGWPETWADKRNGACIEVNAWYVEALAASAYLLHNETGDARRSREAFIARFFISQDPYFVDSFENNKKRIIVTPMGSVPGMYIFSPSIQKVLRRLSSPDVLTEAGMRSMSSTDSMYDRGYHTGQIWPLMTGWHAIACYNNGIEQTGFRCLKTFMDLAFSSEDPGRINETYDGETFEPRGQFAQVWSHSLFIQAVLEGLLNLVPQWRTGLIPIYSAVNRLPPEINFIEVKNILFKGSVFNITIKERGPPIVEKHH
ncbi:MAG: hypothetical protein M1327_07280 [Candidatus Thermoplasmatota archaeon]|nr:hypothetical protein [Candidatus Thermoplasmatota archaeon]